MSKRQWLLVSASINSLICWANVATAQAVPQSNGTAETHIAGDAGASATLPPAVQVPASDTSRDAVAGDAEPEGGQDIVVTGSRIARSGFGASTPVAVVGAEDIKLSGQVNVERALLEMPQVIQSAGAFGNSVTGSGGGFADVNLRGLGSNRNLVLVNGRRYAIFSAAQITDTNTIPSALIERTEIVTGGSSAVYGSDAITGVVNFILKDSFEGIDGRAQVNMIPHSQTPTFNLDLTLGQNFAGDRGNITLALNYLDRRPNFRRDFEWSRQSFALVDGCIGRGTGTPISPGTPLSVPSGQTCVGAGGEMGYIYSASPDVPNGRIYGLPADSAASPALRAAYAAAGLAGLNANGVTFSDAGTAERLYRGAPDSYDNTPTNNLQFPQERYMANAFAHFDVSDRLTVFSEFHYSRNTVAGTIAPANYNAPFLIDVGNPYVSPGLRNVLRLLDAAETGSRTVSHGPSSFTTTPGDGRAAVSIGRRFAELESRRSINTRDMFRTSMGARGQLGDVGASFLTDLRFEAYYTYSNAKEDILVTDGVSKSRLQQSILSQGGAAPVCNLFGQNMSAACIGAVAVDATARNEASLQVAQANVTGTVFTLPAGPAGFSLGGEWRKTSASFTPNADLQSGDVAGYTATLPTRGSVGVKEVFGEIRLPLIHDTPLIDLLALNAGFRGSDYSLSGIGTVWTYFAGADWQVARGLAFRGQYQRAIRAPSVGELYGGQTVNSVGANDPCSSRLPIEQQTAQVRALCIATGVPAALVFSPVVQPAGFIYTINGGNPDLAAEKADTYTAGVVFSPRVIPRLDVSVDYFDINVDGAIGQLGGGLQNVLNLCYYTVQAADSVYCRAVPRSSITGEVLDSNPARVLAGNTGGLRTRGIDAALRYSVPLNVSLPGMGKTSTLSLRSNFSYLLEYTSVPVQDLPAVRNECAGGFGGVCGEPKPRLRGSSRMTWGNDVLNLSLRHRYIGAATRDTYLVPLRRGNVTVPRLDTLTYPKLKAQNYFDLAADLRVNDDFTIYGGVNNVFDRYPPMSFGSYDQIGTELFLGVNVKL